MEQDMNKMLDEMFGKQQEGTFGSMLLTAAEKYDNEAGKNRSMDIDRDVKSIYEGMPSHTQKMIFRNDIRTAQWILLSIADLLPEKRTLFGSAKKQNLKKAWEILAAVWARSLVMSPGEALARVSAHPDFADIPKESLKACVAEALGFALSRNPMLKKNAIIYLAREQMVSRFSGQNRGMQDSHVNDPDYGLDPSKPIFVQGFGADRVYLNALRTADDRKLSYKRLGSTNVPDVKGPVDVYDLFLPGWEKYMTIYVCVYGDGTSHTAPRGLKLLG